MKSKIQKLQNQNFQKMLEKTLANLSHEKRPRLLLHACCAPCSSYVLEYLCNFFDITIFYYNPNIYPKREYERRLCELKRFLEEFPPAKKNVILRETIYNSQDFYDAIEIKKNPVLAFEKEKGERCRKCYALRLQKTFSFAKENHFDYFCTTLSISPHKDAQKINEEGHMAGGKMWLFSDFKKCGGFLRSLKISQEFGLYRQNYCGCIFSMKNSESKNKIKNEEQEFQNFEKMTFFLS